MSTLQTLPNLAVDIESLESLALLLEILKASSAPDKIACLSKDRRPQIRAALEWLAARGIVELVNPSWLYPTRVPSVSDVATICWDVRLTDRGRGLANLLPVMRP